MYAILQAYYQKVSEKHHQIFPRSQRAGVARECVRGGPYFGHSARYLSVEKSEERQSQGCFATSRSPTDPHPLPGWDLKNGFE